MNWLKSLAAIIVAHFAWMQLAALIGRITRKEQIKMFEGKEIDMKFGNGGALAVDVDDKLMVVIELSYEKSFQGFSGYTKDGVSMDLIDLLRQAEAKVNNTVFTGAIETIAKLMGR